MTNKIEIWSNIIQATATVVALALSGYSVYTSQKREKEDREKQRLLEQREKQSDISISLNYLEKTAHKQLAITNSGKVPAKILSINYDQTPDLFDNGVELYSYLVGSFITPNQSITTTFPSFYSEIKPFTISLKYSDYLSEYTDIRDITYKVDLRMFKSTLKSGLEFKSIESVLTDTNKELSKISKQLSKLK